MHTKYGTGQGAIVSLIKKIKIQSGSHIKFNHEFQSPNNPSLKLLQEMSNP